MLTQEDQRRFKGVVRAIRELHLTDLEEARQLEIELCSQALKEVEAMPEPADLNEEACVEICRVNLRQVLAGDIGIENIVAIDREPAPQFLIAPMSRLIH
jgi:hypothetical protein